MSPEASAYLNHALDLMQRYALHRKDLDWPSLRSTAFAYAKDAQTLQQTYPAIVFACTQLHDHSSSLIRPRGTATIIEQQVVAIESQARQAAHVRITTVEPSPFANRRSFILAMLKVGERRYAYLVIPSSSLDHAEDDAASRRHLWAEELFSLVSKAVEQGAQGWIIDLRGTKGMHAQPSLAGLQSLLGDGRILRLRGNDSNQTMAIRIERSSNTLALTGPLWMSGLTKMFACIRRKRQSCCSSIEERKAPANRLDSPLLAAAKPV